jgi:6-phosphogluconolactonase (cycloisomerase 2 family)
VGGQQNVFHPNGISYDPKSELVWVAEYGAHRIQAFKTDGTSVRKIGTQGAGDGQLSCPQAACVDTRNDLLFVCDQGNQRMCVFRASDGAFVRKWGTYGSTETSFYNPLDVVHDPRSDLLYITVCVAGHLRPALPSVCRVDLVLMWCCGVVCRTTTTTEWWCTQWRANSCE